MQVDLKFKDIESAANKYDELYADGYMDIAMADKVERISKILNEIGLPQTGIALDFGSGSGTHTEILLNCLPHWEMHCFDISKYALDKCKQRLPKVKIEDSNSLKNKPGFFDLIFTHHVLEHVQDIKETFGMFSQLCKPGAYLFHILPCGNAGSFEYNLSAMVNNGINYDVGGRFFYEDPSHLRRLTSAELNAIASENSFYFVDGFYANQFYGAVKWIASSGRRQIANMFNIHNAKTLSSGFKILVYRLFFEWACMVYRMQNFNRKMRLNHRKKIIKFVLNVCLAIPVSSFFWAGICRKSKLEFEKYGKMENGSEMFMIYKKA